MDILECSSLFSDISISFSAEVICSLTAAAYLLQLCLPLCNPMDCSPPGFSVQGILQAGILEWVAMPVTMAGVKMG